MNVGRGTYGEPVVRTWGSQDGRLVIGNWCSIADNVTVLLGGNHHTDWVTTFPFAAWPGRWPGAHGIDGRALSRGDVLIGNDVWIGTNVLILSGVHIGNGAIIGAGSLVASDVPAYAIVAGNPARTIRMRYGPEIVERLERLAWWDWQDALIDEYLPFLLSDNVMAFLTAAENDERCHA